MTLKVVLCNSIKNSNVLFALLPLASAYLLFPTFNFKTGLLNFGRYVKLIFGIKTTIHMTILWDTHLTLVPNTGFLLRQIM